VRYGRPDLQRPPRDLAAPAASGGGPDSIALARRSSRSGIAPVSCATGVLIYRVRRVTLRPQPPAAVARLPCEFRIVSVALLRPRQAQTSGGGCPDSSVIAPRSSRFGIAPVSCDTPIYRVRRVALRPGYQVNSAWFPFSLLRPRQKGIFYG